jgi:hypothetical protein
LFILKYFDFHLMLPELLVLLDMDLQKDLQLVDQV